MEKGKAVHNVYDCEFVNSCLYLYTHMLRLAEAYSNPNPHPDVVLQSFPPLPGLQCLVLCNVFHSGH